MAIATRINLAKIPVKETASKVVKLDFGDGEKEYMIHALDDATRQCIGMLYADQNDVLRDMKMNKLLLLGGLDAIQGDAAVADYLVRNANATVVQACAEIVALTNEFYTAKDAEAEEAEKNSVTETQAETPQA